MDGSMANQQGALPDPKAACHPAMEDSVDLEFEIWTLKVKFSMWQRPWLQEPAWRHLCVNTFCSRKDWPR